LELTWTSVLTFAATTGIVTALLNLVFSVFRECGQRLAPRKLEPATTLFGFALSSKRTLKPAPISSTFDVRCGRYRLNS
jgi:hypothetical protein